MKQKRILTALLLTTGILAVAQMTVYAAQTFTYSLTKCLKYANDSGNKIVIILGWANKKCYYQEFTSNKTVECAFNSKQVNEMAAEIKGKKSSQFSSIESLNSGKKYLSDSLVCSVAEKTN